MKKEQNNPDKNKSMALATFEYALLVFYLGVIILRVIYTEGPTMQMSNVSISISDSLYSLYVSAGLFFSFLIWLVWSFAGRKFSYRITGIEIGLFVFGIAAVISGFTAADKRLAINNIVSLFAPVLCAILLVQILDSTAKIRLLFVVIAALGVVSAYQCADQLLFLNRETVKEFEDNPKNMLEPLNIQEGTLQYFLFEQRLYANNARAYFTTRNSAGSFLLMAYFASVALAIERLLRREANNNKRRFYISDIIVIILIIAIFMTKSKGAIIGLFFAMGLFALYLKFGGLLKAYRKVVLAAFVLLIVAGILIIAWYGLTYKTLPGGNSMLVRWQYWHASAKMFMSHLWTGVGPGNFSNYYSYYKSAAALETVTDPHNFALNILTQYGPLGLIGFLMMIFVTLWKVTNNSNRVSLQSERQEHKSDINKTLVTILFCVWFVLLLGRFSIVPALKSGNLLVVIYIIIRYFLPPAAVFVISLLLLRKYSDSESNNNNAVQRRNTIAAIIFCTMLGVLLHNLTDYAIFEPGIYTTFWFLFAALIAINANNTNQPKKIFFNTLPAPFPKTMVRLGAILLGIAVFLTFIIYVILPVALSTDKINLANKAFSQGRFEEAHNLLDSAAKDDKLSPYALSLNAQIYMQNSEIIPSRSYPFLLIAQSCLRDAIKRNNAGYKNYEDLAGVCQRLSEVSPDEEKAGWLNLAFDFASQAVDRYPGSGRLHFSIAQIADKLGKINVAIEQYNKAVEIEDQYRAQFHKMYPGEKVVSRLGEDKYQYAIKRSAELTHQGEA
jgi:O-antigen ligase